MKKILLIEDEKILSDMYRDRFLQEGFEVILAFSARDGLTVAKNKTPDLIILDFLLPMENGIYFLEKRKTIPEITNIPVIIFSNYDDPKTKELAFELGVREYLIKTDYTPQKITEKIKNFLQ